MSSGINSKEKVLEIVRNRLVYLEYKPGVLLNEKEIGNEFGVSRTPVREAMIELKNYGLINIVPRGGTYVSDIDLLELKNCFFIRGILEGTVAQLATRHLNSSGLEKLEDILSRVKEVDYKTAKAREIVCLDTEFHEVLYANTYNKPLIDVLNQFEYRCMRGWYHFAGDVPENLKIMEGLVSIYEPIKAGDEMLAKQRMEEHVNGFVENLKKKME